MISQYIADGMAAEIGNRSTRGRKLAAVKCPRYGEEQPGIIQAFCSTALKRRFTQSLGLAFLLASAAL